MKVKCIDAGARWDLLTEGHTYTVESENTTNYFLVEVPGYSHIKSRFEIVETDDDDQQAEDPCRKGTCSHSACGKGVASAKRSGSGDMAFFAGVREGYCACNIPKSACAYHS